MLTERCLCRFFIVRMLCYVSFAWDEYVRPTIRLARDHDFYGTSDGNVDETHIILHKSRSSITLRGWSSVGAGGLVKNGHGGPISYIRGCFKEGTKMTDTSVHRQ